MNSINKQEKLAGAEMAARVLRKTVPDQIRKEAEAETERKPTTKDTIRGSGHRLLTRQQRSGGAWPLERQKEYVRTLAATMKPGDIHPLPFRFGA